MNITGQSIRTEPIKLGLKTGGFHPTAMNRYATARRSGSRSSKSVYDREIASKRESPAMASTETLQRILGNETHKTAVSNGIMSRPLISGRASLEFQPDTRMNAFKDGNEIMADNTHIVEENTPKILHY